MLKSPQNKDPSTVSKYTIDMKGGQKVDEDSVIFTQQLREWLKTNERKIMLTKDEEGTLFSLLNFFNQRNQGTTVTGSDCDSLWGDPVISLPARLVTNNFATKRSRLKSF